MSNDQFKELEAWLGENKKLAGKTLEWFTNVNEQTQLFSRHSSRFGQELSALFDQDILPEENQVLRDRLKKASVWFIEKLETFITSLLASTAVTDNRQVAKEFDTRLEVIHQGMCYKKHLLSCCTENFSMENYNSARSTYIKPKFSFSAYSGRSSALQNIMHPDLYFQLKEKRDEFCLEKELPVYMVCNTQSLELMANHLPVTLDQLGSIPGFGPRRLRQFGKDFLEIITAYCEEHSLETSMPEVSLKATKKIRQKSSRPDTKKASLEMFNAGKTIAEIATERKLATATIEGHLGHFIEMGELSIDQLVSTENQIIIRQAINSEETPKVQLLKEKLPDISYAEIKWMLINEKRLATIV